MNQLNFFNSKLASVVRWEDSLEQNLILSVKSDVLFYSSNENGFSLKELYAIKADSPTSKEVGTWDWINGLVIPEPNIWERRANLSRVRMKICVLGNTFLLRVNTSKETKYQAFCNFNMTLHILHIISS